MAPEGPFPTRAFCFGTFACNGKYLDFLSDSVPKLLCFILGKSLPLGASVDGLKEREHQGLRDRVTEREPRGM